MFVLGDKLSGTANCKLQTADDSVMNCPNCGAPMALLANRPCWQCGHCDSIVCPEPAADGLRMTGVQGHPCPVCHERPMSAVLDDRDQIEVCERCKGILLPRLAFAQTITGRRRSAQTPS